MEFDLLEKIDFKTLINLMTGSEVNQEIQSILTEEYEKSLKFNKNLTYENFFYRLCPSLNFKNVEKYTYEYVKKIEKEIKQVEVFNCDKPEDYISTIITGFFCKLVLSKVNQINERIKKSINKITNDIATLNENKRFFRLMNKNLGQILTVREEKESYIKITGKP